MSEHIHVYRTAEQRVAMVAEAVVDSDQYRPAMAGEPLVPVLWDDAECEECGDTTAGWRLIIPANLNRVTRAMKAGCDGLCSCGCHS